MTTKRRQYTTEELWNPRIDLQSDACAYGRQSTKEQAINNIQSRISQTIGLLDETKRIGFKDDGSTGIVTLFIENRVIDKDGNIQIKNASGTWPIDRRPDLKTIMDLVEENKVKTIIADSVDRLFRDEDRIDSNIFIKTCREHDCYVYITSKKMIYNFANPQMSEMFRQEVAFAAAYIEQIIKGTLLRRRDMAVRNGQFGGGYVPMGFIICKEKGPKFNKHIPYAPHAEILNETAHKILQLDIAEFCRQTQIKPVFFPDFESGVHVGARKLKKVKGGYIVNSRDGLVDMLTNPVNIGVVERGNIRVENAHDAIIDRDLYNLLIAKLRGKRTNKERKYYQKKSTIERVGTLKRLLTSTDECNCTYSHNKHDYYYKLYHPGIAHESSYIQAKEIESLIENRLIERIKTYDIGSFQEELKIRKANKIKRVRAIDTRLIVIDEEMDHLADDLNKTRIQSMINKINAKAEKLEQEIKDLNEEQKIINKELSNPDLSVETELAGLNILEKSAHFRQAILEFLIRKVYLDSMSPRYSKVQIDWKILDWGIDEIYIDRKNAHTTPWKEEEMALLLDLYSSDSHETILKALPNRSWSGIKRMAFQHQLKRIKRDTVFSNDMSWKDRQFLEQSNVTLRKWSSSSGRGGSGAIARMGVVS